MSDVARIADLERQLAVLREENDTLDEQVALLVKTEHRLTRAQSEADRQLARVRALSSFALAYSTDELPHDLAARAARLLMEWFAIDRVVSLQLDADTVAGLVTEAGVRHAAPPRLVERCQQLAPAPWVEPAAATEWATELIAAVEGPSATIPHDTVIAGLPLGPRPDVLGLVCWRRPNPRASFFSEPPAEHHLPFLSLLANHLGHALDNTRLTRDLRASTRELADGNARLQASLAHVKDAHERLAQASKLEAIGRLAGGVAHDFNNLLTVILANATMLADDLPPGSPLRDDVAPILEAAERARSVTRQLLLYSRKQDSRPEELRLEAVVEEFSRIGGRLIGEHIRLRITHDARIGTVRIDRTQLEQVLMNLATNARDAMPAGGTLSIETRPATADELSRAGCADDGHRYVVLSVADTGHGMDALTRDRIFEPFFTTKDVARGTGLGLAIVQSVVEQARGHVLVDTSPDTGTCFHLLLPEASQPQTVGVTSSLGTVLVVEDEDSIRDTVRRILGRRGYHVIEARSAAEALATGRTGLTLDLLVTDVVMPEKTGPMVAAELRQSRPDLRVLYMSGYTFDALRAGDLRHGERFLQKPFTPDQLLAEVHASIVPR